MSAPTPPPAYIRGPELAAHLGVSIATLHKWAKKRPNGMPPRIQLGPRVFMWKRADIEKWLADAAEPKDAA